MWNKLGKIPKSKCELVWKNKTFSKKCNKKEKINTYYPNIYLNSGITGQNIENYMYINLGWLDIVAFGNESIRSNNLNVKFKDFIVYHNILADDHFLIAGLINVSESVNPKLNQELNEGWVESMALVPSLLDKYTKPSDTTIPKSSTRFGATQIDNAYRAAIMKRTMTKESPTTAGHRKSYKYRKISRKLKK